MKRFLAVTFVLFACGLPGCARMPVSTWSRPIVDMKGVDQGKYDQDYQECVTYAFQAPGPGTSAAVGAVGGALAGALAARIVDRDLNRGQFARIGAVSGAAGGAVEGARTESQIVKQCLRGRGYNVLN